MEYRTPWSIEIREATLDDAEAVRDVFTATYGETYTYPEFYQTDELRRMILGEETLMLVAEDKRSKKIVGTGSVLLEIGAYSDLLGEFGRLAVIPEARGHGIGGALMQARLERVRPRLHVGLVDARVTHPHSLRIAQGHGFAAVGFSPLKDQFATTRESCGQLVQFFGAGLRLRRNNPHIIPEVHPLAALAMSNAGLRLDAIVEDEAVPFPPDHDFELEELTTEGYAPLLRIQRGRTRHRKVYGPMRLHYGKFMLEAHHAHYLIARRGDRIAGGVGYLRNDLERAVRIFELITSDDAAVQYLLSEVERRCREEEEGDIAYVEIDVLADAPRMQRTLLELGFVPAAYVPAMVFEDVERLDIVRMVRILVPLELGDILLTPEMDEVAKLVLAPLELQQHLPRIRPAVRGAGIFHGLTEEQLSHVARICSVVNFAPDEVIFGAGTMGDALYLVLDGMVEIEMEGAAQSVGYVESGEALGEMGLLADAPHSATATTRTRVEAARMEAGDLGQLIRRRPDIGLVIYRNLANGLGHKLARTDIARQS
ncbi:MAG: GNAT family N-acetyltransferase [Planctomycetota bacterium]|jgi:CRP-like cAMP-binding protein/GNAT superfamily N-acetyltransferase